MPGIYGFVGEKCSEDAEKNAVWMEQAMKHEGWYSVDKFVNSNVALGRVHLGTLNKARQPIFNEKDNLCIVMDGEVYDYYKEKQNLLEKGHNFKTTADAEFALHLYEEYGNAFASKLHGSFTLAIWDDSRKRLVLANDRFSSRPLYYAQLGGEFLFGSELSALLRRANSISTDPAAIAEFFSFGYVLENKTFLNEIKLLPPATIGIWEDGDFQRATYWELEFSENYKEKRAEDCQEELVFLIRQAVKRRLTKELRLGFFLSGGLDSRFILASVPHDYFPIHTFTWGVRGCIDQKLAQAVASRLGTCHHFVPLSPDFLAKHAERYVFITDGMCNVIFSHGIELLSELRSKCDVLLGGVMGGEIFGQELLPHYLDGGEKPISGRLFEYWNRIIPEEEHSQFFSSCFYSKIKGVARESVQRVIDNAKANFSENKAQYFVINERLRRCIINGPRMVRHQIEYRIPFYDYDVIDFATKVPPKFLATQWLYAKAFRKAFPRLARIPWALHLWPVDPTPLEKFAYRAKNKIYREVKKIMRNLDIRNRESSHLKGIYPSYAEYDEWMRRDPRLRAFVEDLLLSVNALSRSFFNQDYVKRMVNHHFTYKANFSQRICALITFELWCRKNFYEN